MNLQEIMNQMSTLGATIRQKALDLSRKANDPSVKFEDLEKMNTELNEMKARMAALQASYDTLKAAQAGQLEGMASAANQEREEPRSVHEMRKSNEYARAFAYAMRYGIGPRNGMGNEKVKILFDALTEGGGTTPGEDGGFLVPIDIDNSIRELRRALDPLADLFNQESVTAPTGWRVIDTKPTAGMTLVNEMGVIPTDDQPAFAKIPYSLSKYALRVPVSGELLADEAANLMAYLSRWFAKKLVLTENGLILGTLQTLTAAALIPGKTGATAIDGIKSVLNKVLDPALSRSAVILCSQNGFDELDQIKDDNGRGLLQPDPVNPTQYRIFGRTVRAVSNAVLPNVTSGANTTTDLYIGDGHEFATLFQKDGFEVASTNIGGDTWKNDSTEVRGIVRLGVSKFDTQAMVRRNLTL